VLYLVLFWGLCSPLSGWRKFSCLKVGDILSGRRASFAEWLIRQHGAKLYCFNKNAYIFHMRRYNTLATGWLCCGCCLEALAFPTVHPKTSSQISVLSSGTSNLFNHLISEINLQFSNFLIRMVCSHPYAKPVEGCSTLPDRFPGSQTKLPLALSRNEINTSEPDYWTFISFPYHKTLILSSLGGEPRLGGRVFPRTRLNLSFTTSTPKNHIARPSLPKW